MTTKIELSGHGGRLAAEWEKCDAVLLSWPHAGTDWAYMLEEVTDCFIEIVKAITRYARVVIVSPDTSMVSNTLKGFVSGDRVKYVELPTNDTWARDFGMLCTAAPDGRMIVNDFKFNGWGLKFPSCYDNLITRGMIDAGAVKRDAVYANRLGFVLEGGSIDVDGEGAMLTTSECLLSPNRNGDLGKEEIEVVLKETFGCHTVHWLDHGYLAGDDTDSHIDTLARFLPGGKIAYSICDREADEHYEALSAMEHQLKELRTKTGEAYSLVPLYIPAPVYDCEGQRLPATYANFLIVNGAVLLPFYGDGVYDAKAIETIKAAMPLYDIVPIDCRALIQQHGSLHCVTMQVPEGVLV